MKMTRQAICLGSMLIALSLSPARAQDNSSYGSSGKEFLKGALDANRLMIRAGRMAEDRATHPAVRRLGRSLASDHERVQEQLERIGRQHNVTDQRDALTGRHAQELNRLRSRAGVDFDQQFLDMVIDDHQRDLRMLQNRRNNLPEDSAIRNLIDRKLPMVRRHLNMAEAASRQFELALNDPDLNYGEGWNARERVSDRETQDWELDVSNTNEFLGMPTSDHDGTILGLFPAPSRTVEAGSGYSYLARELADGEVGRNVDNVWEADQKALRAPGTLRREQRASSFTQNSAVPRAVTRALREQGWDPQKASIRRMTVYVVESDGERAFVTEYGSFLDELR